MSFSPFQLFADDYVRGDVDEDGRVTVADVTALIDYLISRVWPEESQPQTETFTVNGVTFTMVKVEGGTFMMGGTEEQGEDISDFELPAHQVTLSSYSIGQTEVTQALWMAVMGVNPSRFKGDLNRPVEQVSRFDCYDFINKLNFLTGKTFRLPTEAEFEFAARGGNLSKKYKYSGSNTLEDVAWFYENSNNVTQPVGMKMPNELGLYDMSGNVWEVTSDWFGSYSDEPQTNPTGPTVGTSLVDRGGGFDSGRISCRVSDRDDDSGNPPERSWYNLGLRLVLEL